MSRIVHSYYVAVAIVLVSTFSLSAKEPQPAETISASKNTQRRTSDAGSDKAGDGKAGNGKAGDGKYGFRLAQYTDTSPSLGETPTNSADHDGTDAAVSDFSLTGASADREWPPGLLEGALRQVGMGEGLDALGVSVYGYVEFGFTGILTGPGGSQNGLPLRVYEARRPDNVRFNQTKLTFERSVDMSKDFDFGGRLDMLYGTDSQVNIVPGLFDKQNREAQLDFTQFYVQLWRKTGPDGRGFDFIFGKWYTTIGAEVIDAPDNYLYSRTMLFGFGGPFTHLGGKLTYHFNEEHSAYVAVVNGWDSFADRNKGVSLMGGFTLTGHDRMGGDPRSTVIWNFIIGPEQENKNWGPNRFTTDVIWTYLWNERLTGVAHGMLGIEKDVPSAIGRNGALAMRDADWWGFAYTLNYQVNDQLSTTGRVEYFRDSQGTRTGFRGDFISLTAGLGITPMPDNRWLKDLTIRPEIRADFSANQEPFDDSVQFTAAVDFVYRF